VNDPSDHTTHDVDDVLGWEAKQRTDDVGRASGLQPMRDSALLERACMIVVDEQIAIGADEDPRHLAYGTRLNEKTLIFVLV